jgi:hypothetical protein
LGRLTIPSSDEDFDNLSDIGKEKSRIIELNEIAYTELIVSVDVKLGVGKRLLILLKAARLRIILMGMQLLPGKSSRTSMSPFLTLL